ncbi:ABC transporter ATP-binding protein [Celeribacter neptunius]|uniref:Spermidine/putrescine import ATP-binding protein PotA n=1 Tax=Celeribacter neptunius TaxID=588602 RepID=A0A1I3L655_9RHOB|nr:ABC transporter ATP-binding protein [Celeribacter neptunius]SFI79915.1 spermidine/putrescine transport system ATP-binding protein [Celeribacter neptunius]
MSRSSAIEVVNVSKNFGDYTALDHVDFKIFQNEFFTLLGPSGCGKTTLLRMIAGFETPSSGTLLLNGQEIAQMPAHKRRVNTVFQNYALFPHMTLSQNIAFGLKNLGWDKARITARVGQMLEMVHMEQFAQRKPDQLSGGQRQRIALARALAAEPEVLLLDEPLSALDLKLRQAMRDELRALQRDTGITFVFVTHDQEEALDMSDRIAVMGKGRVQQIGSPKEIYEDPTNRFVADFIGDTNFLEGEVILLDGAKATIRTALGAEITTTHQGLTGPGPATMSIRPEKIGVGDQAEGVVLTGTVRARNYMGGFTHYTVQIGEQTLRLSRRNAHSHQDSLEIGAAVQVGFRESDARVLGQ